MILPFYIHTDASVNASSGETKCAFVRNVKRPDARLGAAALTSRIRSREALINSSAKRDVILRPSYFLLNHHTVAWHSTLELSDDCFTDEFAREAPE